jgi:tetratricopeptide (TPR) repeat protein
MDANMTSKATALAKAGRIADAEAAFEALLADKNVRPATLKEAVLFHLRYSFKYRRALQLVGHLVKASPQHASSHALAAEALAHIGDLPAALKHADRAVGIDPDNADARFAAAFVALQRNAFADALAHADHALTIRPDHRPSQLQRGWALLGVGQAEDAAHLCRALWKKTPDDINVLGLYMDATSVTADDPIFQHMRDDLLPRYMQIGGDRLAHLLKLLGKGYNDQGAYTEAFQAFADAKAARVLPYDAAQYASYVNTLCEEVTRSDFPTRGLPDDRPVLIVGMPRSGSTLIEQILASHPKVASIGESPNLHRITQQIGIRRHNPTEMTRAIKQIPADGAVKLAKIYLSELDRIEARKIIDKSLHNFELLGIFAAMLPQARIIHIKRDPMDTCVSCYMQNLSPWHRYTQDLDDLGQSFVAYRKLMAHWTNILPNPILEMRYEDIVDDLEGQARKAVAFVGLDWDPACLDFQKGGQQSRTLSARQVRQPLYRSSMQRWRRYDTFLDPLKVCLAPLYPDGFDRPAS